MPGDGEVLSEAECSIYTEGRESSVRNGNESLSLLWLVFNPGERIQRYPPFFLVEGGGRMKEGENQFGGRLSSLFTPDSAPRRDDLFMRAHQYTSVLGTPLRDLMVVDHCQTIPYSQTTTMVEPLPNEIVEAILGNLYSDRQTLLNCALVGRAWILPSQRGILRKIVLLLTVDTVNLANIGQLSALFYAKPHLKPYVRTLELQKSRIVPASSKSSQSTAAEVHNATAILLNQLSGSFPPSNVNRLLLFGINWPHLSSSLRTALRDMFKIPSLAFISLNNFTIPRLTELGYMLSIDNSGNAHLKELNIRIINCYGSYDLPGPNFGSGATTSSSPRPSIPFNLPNLQSLCLHGIASRAVVTILRHVGQSLRELEVSGFCSSREGSNPDILSRLFINTPNLRRLLLARLWQDETLVPKVQAFLMPFLNTDRRNALQHLTLKVDVVQREPLMDPGQWDQWAVIDTMLSMKPQFVLLKTVVIMVTVFSRVSANFSTMKNVEESLSGKFPLLEGSGKLMVEIQNGEMWY